MIRFGTLLRCSAINSNKINPSKTGTGLPERFFSTKKSSSSSSSTSSSSDDEHKKTETKKKSAEAREKLNLLLNRMIQEDTAVSKQPKLDLAKPRNQRQKDMRKEPGIESIKTEPVALTEKQVVKAVKDVAESIGGDVKQTESELLQKLLNPVKDEPAQSTTSSLSEIFKDMKIDRQTKAGEEISRAEQVRQLLKHARTNQQTRPKGMPQRRVPRQSLQPKTELIEERVDLFGSEPLGIFPSRDVVASWSKQEVNKTWNTLHDRELRLVVTHPPANYFQQMILWTEQQKLWRFPIDNEQDMENEQNVYFAEHVFMEKYLEPWCPPKGPIRHFMELVCVGLSKNPYLSVQNKKEHILWFRDYFAEKKQLLHEVGAIPPDFDMGKQSKNQIES